MKDEQQQVPAEGSDPGSGPDEKSLISPSGTGSDQQHNLLSDLPPEQREIVTRYISSITEFHSRGPSANPLISKFNDEHVHKLLDQVERQESGAHELRKSNRLFQLLYFLVAVFILILAVGFLQPRDPELLDTILKYLFAFAGGFGSGATYIVIKDRNR